MANTVFYGYGYGFTPAFHMLGLMEVVSYIYFRGPYIFNGKVRNMDVTCIHDTAFGYRGRLWRRKGVVWRLEYDYVSFSWKENAILMVTHLLWGTILQWPIFGCRQAIGFNAKATFITVIVEYSRLIECFCSCFCGQSSLLYGRQSLDIPVRAKDREYTP